MARKKVARKKAVAKTNPAMALKDRLAKLTAELKAVTAEMGEVVKRTTALEKANASKAPAKKAAPKKAATKKAASKKKTAKKRRSAAKKKAK
jgi:hypothetical protein